MALKMALKMLRPLVAGTFFRTDLASQSVSIGPNTRNKYCFDKIIVTDHTAMKAPVLIRSLKLSMARLG